METKINTLGYWVAETIPFKLDTYYTAALQATDFEVIGKAERFFTPQGWGAVFLMEKAHFAIHTFPDAGKSFVELVCYDDKLFANFIKHVATDKRQKTLFLSCVAL